jgi:3-oxoacid CoA-transferase subunit B
VAATETVAAAVAAALPSWSYVNLGIGLPTLLLDGLRARTDIRVHTENGAVGARRLDEGDPWDGVSVDPSKAPMTVGAGGAVVDSLQSFRLIHSGRLDLAVMGAYQVGANGDLANWRRPGSEISGIGGAADLALGARAVWVAMAHTAPNGEPRLVDTCTAAVTARGVVRRVFTELGTFEPAADGFRVLDLHPGVDPETVEARTGAPVAFTAATP